MEAHDVMSVEHELLSQRILCLGCLEANNNILTLSDVLH
jgi:hypothetical protein